MKIRHRAYAYITHGDRLLLFKHTEAPEAGIQVPAGGIEEGEDPAAAALREALEETGLKRLKQIGFLGQDTLDLRDRGVDELQTRWFYHIACEGTPPARWTHGEYNPSGTLTHPFEFFWASLPESLAQLAPNYSDYLPDLTASLKVGA